MLYLEVTVQKLRWSEENKQGITNQIRVHVLLVHILVVVAIVLFIIDSGSTLLLLVVDR